MSKKRIAGRNEPPRPLAHGDVVEAKWLLHPEKPWVKGKIVQIMAPSEHATCKDFEYEVEFINQGSGKEKAWVSEKIIRRFGNGVPLESSSKKSKPPTVRTAVKPINTLRTPPKKATSPKTQGAAVVESEEDDEEALHESSEDSDAEPPKGAAKERNRKKSVLEELHIQGVTHALNGEERVQT